MFFNQKTCDSTERKPGFVLLCRFKHDTLFYLFSFSKAPVAVQAGLCGDEGFAPLRSANMSLLSRTLFFSRCLKRRDQVIRVGLAPYRCGSGTGGGGKTSLCILKGKKKKKGREKEKKDREKERASTFLNRPGLVLGRMTQA